MAATFSPEPPGAAKRPLLSTRVGVVALSIVVVVAGNVVLAAVKTAAPRVGAIEVSVHVSVDATDGEVGSLATSPISPPHCAAFRLERSPLRLEIWAADLDSGVATVVLVHYADHAGFSGGGDDTAVFLLRQGERARVVGALAPTLALYELAPGAKRPIVPLAADLTAAHSLEARYVVKGTLAQGPKFRGQTGNFVVDEAHDAEAFGGVEVVKGGPLICM